MATSTGKDIDPLDWTGIAAQLDAEGYAVLPALLSEDAIRHLARETHTDRGTLRASLAVAGLGRGELVPIGSALPSPLEEWSTTFYPHLAAIAHRWHSRLGVAPRHPTEINESWERGRNAGYAKWSTTWSCLGPGDYVTLHQHGGQTFPLQVVALLSEPGKDFVGGEFVMTEQRPRMQSRPMVLPLKRGDAAIITTVRPVKGAKGDYCARLKHAISRVHRGQRLGMTLTLDDTGW